MDASIIIVNWNSRDFVLACVRSIRSQTRNTQVEVIVVDNASFDGCERALSDLDPTVRFIQSDSNLGFAGANNLGAGHATGKYLLFLNPDTEVLDEAIDRLAAYMETLADVGVLGCRLLNTDRTLQTSCVQPFPTIWNRLLDAGILQTHFFKHRAWIYAKLIKESDATFKPTCFMKVKDLTPETAAAAATSRATFSLVENSKYIPASVAILEDSISNL